MQCLKCGHELVGRALFCPKCGHRLEQPEVATENRSAGLSEHASDDPREGWGLTVGVIVVTAVVLLVVVGLGALAVYYGLADRARIEQQAAEEHFQKGVVYLSQDQLELALAEFELTFELDPKREDAQTRAGQARQRLQTVPTATPMLQKETKAAYLDEVRDAYTRSDWEQVFVSADLLLALDASYSRAEVDQMLFEAFYRRGLELIAQDQIPEAIRFFERALDLRPDSAPASRERDLATLYLTAMGSWGADWAKTIAELGELYLLDPEYKDVRMRLYDAHDGYGEVLSQQGEWCQAATQFAQAVEMSEMQEAVGKREAAQDRCDATPTPTLDTASSTGDGRTPTASPQIAPASLPGVYYGRLQESEHFAQTKISFRGKVLDRHGSGVAGTRVQIRAWDWSAVALTDGNGQYSFDGLTSVVTYTLFLLDLKSEPFDVAGVAGEMAFVDFAEGS